MIHHLRPSLLALLAFATLPAAGQMAATSNGKFVGNVLRSTTTPDPVFDTYWNQVTPENSGKWASVEATRDVMNWSQLDFMYAYTRARGIPFKQHTFIWGQQTPAWITTLTEAEQREEVEEWIAAFAARYPDTELIDVVNEPLHAPAEYRAALGGAGTTGWDWVIWSFEKTRQYFPNAKLLLNDYNIINSDTATTNYLTIINLLKDRGLIDGIGEQAHFFESTSITTIQNNLNRLAATGLPIYISELDINLADDTAQSNRYQALFPVFWTHPAVRGITFWGYKQGVIWRTDGYLLRTDGSERPAMTWLKNYIAANPQSFNASVIAPANSQVVSNSSPVSAAATVAYGTAPFTVTFQKKLDSETEFTTISSVNTPPYTAELGILPLGTYQIRTIVTDNVSATATSPTNTFTVTEIQTNDGTWLGISGNWTDTGVWSGGIIADGADSTAFFTGMDINDAKVITLNGNRTIGNITFTDTTTSSHNLTITGNTLTLDRTSGVPGIDVTQAGRQLIISSIIAGNDGLQKNGAGTLKLTNANAWTGGLIINAGTVFVDTATGVNALSSGKVTIGDVANTGASAELLFTATGNFPSFNNLIDVRGNGTANLRVVGYNPTFSGAVNLGNNLSVISNNNSGSTIGISGGITGSGNLTIQSNAANGSANSAITFSGATVNMVGSITNSGTTTSTTASNTTISAVIGANVTGVTQNSTNSQLILTGNNTFTGDILISSGTLQANRTSSGAAPTSGALGNTQALGRTATISSGGTLRFGVADVMGDGGSAPKLTLITNGGTILNGGNFINSLGPLQLNGGTLNSSGTGTGFKLTGTVTVGGSAVSTISSGGNIGSNSLITYDVADAVAGSGSDLNVTAALADVFGAGGIIKTGPGTMTLSAANTYSGGTRIDHGTLALGADNTLPAAPVSVAAGTLDAATFSDNTIGTLDVSDAASTIHLGSGAKLAFAASNAVDWTGGTLNLAGSLNFSGGPSSSLRFGTTNTGLTPGQLLQIASPGWTHFALDSDGYLTAIPATANYLSWATANNVTGGETGDHDNDGVKNLIEYALVDGGERGELSGLTITYTKRGGVYGSDLTYIIQTSETLDSDSWSAAVTQGPEILISNPTINYTFIPGTSERMFARLKVMSSIAP